MSRAKSWAGVTCSVGECESQVRAIGYCLAHYKRFRRWGDPLVKRPTKPASERFWSKVAEVGDCWEWTAGTINTGYGAFHPTKGSTTLAHRFAFEDMVCDIPEGLVLDHLCRNRLCVNPEHLEPVTNEENLRRGAGYALQNGMRVACKRGHLATSENRYTNPTTQRTSCRECSRIADRQPHRNAALRRANRKAA